jgi:hypothetical protein
VLGLFGTSAAGSPISTGKMSAQGFRAHPDGKYKGFTIPKWLPDFGYEYYRLSGRPFRSTMEQLDLEEFMPWSQES